MYLLAAPLIVVLGGGLLAPMLIFFTYSFYQPGLFTFQPGFTLTNYANVLRDRIYWQLAVNSVGIGLVTAAIAVVLGYLLAAYLVQAGRLRPVLLALTAVSVLGGYLVRIYAWRIILGSEGILNTALLRLGLIDRPIEILFTPTAVVIALVNVFIPFAALLIYAALENVDRDLVQAARDLGAGPLEAFRRVTLPLTGRAVYFASAFVFLLAAADYVTPQLVGGRGGAMIGVAVADQFLKLGNWPAGAALSFVIAAAFAAVLGVVWLLFSVAHVLPRRASS